MLKCNLHTSISDFITLPRLKILNLKRSSLFSIIFSPAFALLTTRAIYIIVSDSINPIFSPMHWYANSSLLDRLELRLRNELFIGKKWDWSREIIWLNSIVNDFPCDTWFQIKQKIKLEHIVVIDRWCMGSSECKVTAQ